MIGDDAREVILAHLARPTGRWEPAGQSSGGWQSGTYVGGSGFVADMSTVRFLKSRQAGARSAHYVTFDGTLPQRQDRKLRFGYIYAIEQTDEGRRITGDAGGAGDASVRSRPWVNLAGGHANDHFWAGGKIERTGADIARVQLRFADGHVVDDDPTNDVALFIVNRPVQTPATVVLLDHAGGQIAEHPGFPDI